jgi:hypothetical protein
MPFSQTGIDSSAVQLSLDQPWVHLSREEFEDDLRRRWFAGEITEAEAQELHEAFLDASPGTRPID